MDNDKARFSVPTPTLQYHLKLGVFSITTAVSARLDISIKSVGILRRSFDGLLYTQ